MNELSWLEAIKKVLSEKSEPIHYEEITEEIIERSLRRTTGATPAYTVNNILNSDIQRNGNNSLFVKTDRAEYSLRNNQPLQTNQNVQEGNVPSGLIKCFGMYWKRDYVSWKSSGTKIYGKELSSSLRINLSEQIGIYLLHDNHDVVYVGQATHQPIVNRLNDHTKDKKSIRWNRFSWFGFMGISNEGNLLTVNDTDLNLDNIIKGIEGILIECLEPRLNMRSGDKFGIELQQDVSDDIKKIDILEILGALKNSVGNTSQIGN